MTASKTIRAMLVHLRRTIERTLRHVTVASATLTISMPSFVKLEIKIEPKQAKPARRRRQVAVACPLRAGSHVRNSGKDAQGAL